MGKWEARMIKIFTFPFNVGDILVIKDIQGFRLAPKGRNQLTIRYFRDDGWVGITYADGTDDYLTYSLLEGHWGYSTGQDTKLWQAMHG